MERSGAAQGLAELCVTLGASRLQLVLADALPLRDHAKAAPREVHGISVHVYIVAVGAFSGKNIGVLFYICLHVYYMSIF